MEITHLRKENVVAFRIPNTSFGKGYNLNDWKDMIWEGQIQVISKNNNLRIELRNLKDNSEFGVCPIPKQQEQAIVKTNDSSRGFALRLENQGRFAWIGMAFRDRNDAFDFNVCLQEFTQKYQQLQSKQQPEQKPMDFTFQKGQKIKLNIKKDQPDSEDHIEYNNSKNKIAQQKQSNNFSGFDVFSDNNQTTKQQNNFCDFTQFNNNKQNDIIYQFSEFNLNNNNFFDFPQNNKQQCKQNIDNNKQQNQINLFDFGDYSNQQNEFQNNIKQEQNDLFDFDDINKQENKQSMNYKQNQNDLFDFNFDNDQQKQQKQRIGQEQKIKNENLLDI